MMTYDAYWAIVIIDSVFMVMRHCHECGGKKEQHKKNCKTFDSAHGDPFRDEHRLIIINGFVKTCLDHKNSHFSFNNFRMKYGM